MSPADTPKIGGAASAGPADHHSIIERMRQIAAASTDSLLLCEGPPHPDAKLLDLCSEVLDAVRAEKRARSASDEMSDKWTGSWSPQQIVERDELVRRLQAASKLVTRLAGRARKIRATTPAGIYAKALIVSTSRTGAPHLAASLATDLISLPALRASIWPTDGVAGGRAVTLREGAAGGAA